MELATLSNQSAGLIDKVCACGREKEQADYRSISTAAGALVRRCTTDQHW